MEKRECRYVRVEDLFNAPEPIKESIRKILDKLETFGVDAELKLRIDKIRTETSKSIINKDEIDELIGQLTSAGYDELARLMNFIMDNSRQNFLIAGAIYEAEDFSAAAKVLQTNVGVANLDGQVYNAILRKADGNVEDVERVEAFKAFAGLKRKELPLISMFNHLPEEFNQEGYERLRALTQGAKILPLSNSQRSVLLPGLKSKYSSAPQKFKDLVNQLFLFIGESQPF